MKTRLFALSFLFASSAYAQTTINLTVIDTSAQTWMNGTWKVHLQQSPGTSGGPPFNLISGGGLLVDQAGALNTVGQATMSLPANANIAPALSVWQFSVCPDASSQCFSQLVTVVTTSPQTLNISPPPIVVDVLQTPPPILAYSNSEIRGASKGTIYYNTTSSTYQQCNAASGGTCTSWSGLAGGGPGAPPNSVQYNNAGTFGGSVFIYNPSDSSGNSCSSGVPCATIGAPVDSGAFWDSSDAINTANVSASSDVASSGGAAFSTTSILNNAPITFGITIFAANGASTGQGDCFVALGPPCASGFFADMSSSQTSTASGQDLVGYTTSIAFLRNNTFHIHAASGFVMESPVATAGEKPQLFYGLDVEDMQGVGTTKTAAVHIQPQTNPASTNFAVLVEPSGGPSSFQALTATSVTDSGLTPSNCVQAGAGGLLTTTASPCAAGGAGTVTSVSAGNLTPLFNTSVATPTTTPALTFAAISQSANQFYASPAGSSGVPGFRAIASGDIPTGSLPASSGNCTGGQFATGFNSGGSMICGTPLGGVHQIQFLQITSGICTTGGGAEVGCSMGPFNWPAAFSSTSYSITCTPTTITGSGTNPGIYSLRWTSKSTTQFSLFMQAGSASAAGTNTTSEIDCIGAQ